MVVKRAKWSAMARGLRDIFSYLATSLPNSLVTNDDFDFVGDGSLYERDSDAVPVDNEVRPALERRKRLSDDPSYKKAPL